MLFKKKKAQPSLSFDFNAAVREAYKNYPKLKGKAVFYDATSGKLQSKGVLLKPLSRFRWKKEIKTVREGFVFAKGRKGRKRIMIFTSDPRKGLLYTTGGGSFLFDHELGHLLTGSLGFPGIS